MADYFTRVPGPLEVMRRLGLNVPSRKQVGKFFTAVPEFVGPQADVAGMVRDAGQVVPNIRSGDYGQALANLGMAAAAIPFMAFPGTVSQVKGATKKVLDNPQSVEELGEKLATAQQVGPERTMPHVLNAMHESDAGYAAGYLVEHIGDLTRKMGDGVGVLGPVKLRDIKEKVGKGLRKLRYGNVEGEFNESMKGKNVKKLNKLFEKYADEHSKLPIFNKPQWLAREAAVSVGKKDFNRTRELLEELEILIDNPNSFYKLNSSIDPTIL